MRNGFTHILLVVMVSLFLAVPVAFFILYGRNSNEMPSVQGTSSNENGPTKRHFYVTVESPSGAWQLLQYLCNDFEECTQSLTSGVELSSISGGSESSSSVLIEEALSWKEYSYIKVFVRSGWGRDKSSFEITDLGGLPQTQKVVLESSDDSFEAVIIPLKSVGFQTVSSVVFKDSTMFSY